MQLEELAVKKWGSAEGFQKERDARAEKRLQNAASPKKQGVCARACVREARCWALFQRAILFLQAIGGQPVHARAVHDATSFPAHFNGLLTG